MQIIYDDKSLEKYMKQVNKNPNKYSILIDKYIKGIEIEVDAISDGEDILIPGIMEHVERTGVHSGDSITMYPYHTLSEASITKLTEFSSKIARALNIVGLFNIQYVYDGNDIYVIEVNPRASRTIPILSKVTNISMVKLAVQVIIGKKIRDLGYGIGLYNNNNSKKLYAIKVPVFSNEKLLNVDSFLGPEMKSTGEVMGIDSDFNKAVYKGFIASGINVPVCGNVYISLNKYYDKADLDVIKLYYEMGFKLFASKGTEKILRTNAINCEQLDIEYLMEHINEKNIKLIINTPNIGNNPVAIGFKLRRKAAEYRIPVFTCMDTARFFLKAIQVKVNKEDIIPLPMGYYFN